MVGMNCEIWYLVYSLMVHTTACCSYTLGLDISMRTNRSLPLTALSALWVIGSL